MNKLTIIGNLTRDPELRTTSTGVSVCSFTVAVNRRQSGKQAAQQEEADFFRVTAWRERGESCAKYLAKGRKVCVIGPVSINSYTGRDGKPYANMEVTAEYVEFVGSAEKQKTDTQSGMQVVDEEIPFTDQPVTEQMSMDDELPF